MGGGGGGGRGGGYTLHYTTNGVVYSSQGLACLY